MTLSPDQFPTYFAACNDGHPPFSWQVRLLDHVYTEGAWPEVISAPTGAGKTAVVDVHIFLNALAALGVGPRVPRRLVTVVDRRAIVDQHAARTREINETLRTSDNPVLQEVQQALVKLHPTAVADRLSRDEVNADNTIATPEVIVHSVIRGALPRDRTWLDHPTACGVINGTPDMLGSRLLFGGYGSSRFARPREAGLLAYDTVMMVDEAHLNRQLVVTGRRIAGIEAVATEPVAAPPLQVVETSATPDDTPDRVVVGVEPDDIDPAPDTSDVLTRRLTTPKPVTFAPVPSWPARKKTTGPQKVSAKYLQALDDYVDSVQKQLAASSTDDCKAAKTVCVIVNQVTTALRLAEALRKRNLCVVTWVGPLRHIDRAHLEGEYPGLMTVTGNNNVDVVVATQTLEVGVDLDFAGLVTELASGSALAQRFGRVNRRGMRPVGPIVVVGPVDEKTASAGASIYDGDELAAAWGWARSLHDAAPWSLTKNPPPAASPRRMLYQRPELYDAYRWACTSDDLLADEPLELWLRDDLKPEQAQAAVVMRGPLPVDDVTALTLLRHTPPHADEAFAAPMRTIRRTAEAVLAWEPTTESEKKLTPEQVRATRRAWVFRDRQLHRLWPDSNGDGNASAAGTARGAGSKPDETPPPGSITPNRLRPGDVVIVAAGLPLTRDRVLDPDNGTHEPELALAWGAPDAIRVFFPAAETDTRTSQPTQRTGSSLDWMDSLPTAEWFTHAAELAEADEPMTEVQQEWANTAQEADPDGRRWDVLFPKPTAGEDVPWMAIRQSRARWNDPEVMQTQSPTPAVSLQAHSQAVQDRCAEVAQLIGLSEQHCDSLALAGLHHDVGKADARFQRMLHGQSSPDSGPSAKAGSESSSASESGVVLAKSRQRSDAQAKAALAASGLPPRWRHEQASAVMAWADEHVNAHPAKELVARLVGTSHGHGRAGFPLHADDLTDGIPGEENLADAVVTLFGEGLWETLLDSTHNQYGVWGCAYLEALLRAADTQVSQEGS